MSKNMCPKCGRYAILLKEQNMCWDCYIVECQEFKPECFGGEE